MSKQRDAKGRFLPGNKGGPGRRPLRETKPYEMAFKEAVSPESFKEATEQILKKALEGDTHAYKLVIQYALGKPIQRTEIDMRSRQISIDIQAALEMVYGTDDQLFDDGS
jgi:hypothetical protein